MIIVSVFGGLGNQMFQYACGKAIASKLGVELKLDTTFVTDRTPRKDFTYRDYELAVFDVEDELATAAEVRKFIPNLWNSSELLRQLYKFKRLLVSRTLYTEKLKFRYNNEIDLVADNSYLYGYFQTEKYFENLRFELLQRFTLKNPLDENNTLIVKQMQLQNSVSIHVRRGDYTNSPFSLLGVEDYYRKAIDYILSNVDAPVFYIFTNDQEWVEENFKALEINKTIVTINSGDQSYKDMILMSNCKHNICANSSFSWWGAWLNTNERKIVITPRNWFKSTEYVESTYDLIPAKWLSL
jgi:hypothetical protein